MKKLLLSALVACACFGAGLDAKVKGYLDYIAQNACNDEKLEIIDEMCKQMPTSCGQIYPSECALNQNLSEDKTAKKLAKVIRAELKNRTETFGEIFKYAKQKDISSYVMMQIDDKMLETIIKNNLVEHAKDIRAAYGSLKSNQGVSGNLKYYKASKELKDIFLK